jgi:hypothetical protein
MHTSKSSPDPCARDARLRFGQPGDQPGQPQASLNVGDEASIGVNFGAHGISVPVPDNRPFMPL